MAAPPTCTGEYKTFCQDHAVWRRDTGCGITEEVEQCPAGCSEDESGAACVQPGPCDDQPGTVQCGQSCVDPLSDRLNCGGCGRVCGRNEQCVQGSCELIPGCVVVCDTNVDCGQGMVCVQAGSCTASRCEPTQRLVVNETDAAQLVSQFANSLVSVEVRMDGTGYVFTATNQKGSSQESV